MDRHEQAARLGAAVVLGALVLRLLAGGAFQRVALWLAKPEIQSFLLYLETGRIVRFSPSLEENADFAGESPGPGEQVQSLPPVPVFTAAAAEDLELTYSCSLRPDLGELLERPLEWDLLGEEPTVLILHTHATESYTRQGEAYRESSAYRTLDENYNMLSVGDALARVLEENGIRVIHDRTLHDYPSYNGSYTHARQAIAGYLEEYPSIRLVLDLHRDALEQEGRQLRTAAEVAGEPSAQLMLVVGTNVSRQSHENWQENLALALKLQVMLERENPGITRRTVLRGCTFHQELSPGMLIVEVGAAGNTLEEAMLAMQPLAAAILALQNGVNI